MLIFPQHQIVVRIDKNQANHAREADRQRKTEGESDRKKLRETLKQNTDREKIEKDAARKRLIPQSQVWRKIRGKRVGAAEGLINKCVEGNVYDVMSLYNMCVIFVFDIISHSSP